MPWRIQRWAAENVCNGVTETPSSTAPSLTRNIVIRGIISRWALAHGSVEWLQKPDANAWRLIKSSAVLLGHHRVIDSRIFNIEGMHGLIVTFLGSGFDKGSE